MTPTDTLNPTAPDPIMQEVEIPYRNALPYFPTTEIPLHTSELYAHTAIADGVQGFDAVTEREIATYDAQGYLVIHDAFSPDEVASARQGLENLIAGRCDGFRYFDWEPAARPRLAELGPEERRNALRKLMYFTTYEPRLAAVANHPRLLALVTRLMGATPKMFQDMALLKPPRMGREKPWHQDHAYFDLPEGTRIIGVWIAIDEATTENGCMVVWPGGHKSGPIPHFQRRDWQICDTTVQGQPFVAVPLKPGGCLLFDGLLPHGTPHNHSDAPRHAVQFHYQPENVARTSLEERMKLFGSEGRNVSC